MPTETNWNGSQQRRAVRILVGYNLPFVLWTVYALLTGLAGPVQYWTCPVGSICGWCPGCGLTREYARLLVNGELLGWWLLAVLGGFVTNSIYSLVKAERLEHAEFNRSEETIAT